MKLTSPEGGPLSCRTEKGAQVRADEQPDVNVLLQCDIALKVGSWEP